MCDSSKDVKSHKDVSFGVIRNKKFFRLRSVTVELVAALCS